LTFISRSKQFKVPLVPKVKDKIIFLKDEKYSAHDKASHPRRLVLRWQTFGQTSGIVIFVLNGSGK
jgi:hypothetical protein